MAAPPDCRVCNGRLKLIQAGDGHGYASSIFSPSYHRADTHGALSRCRKCGTVHQLSLPRGEELHNLYRGMSDDLYLREETGRRRMARRLLDLLGGYVPGGRMLQVGCGYGLLLDEARRRGYVVQGVDLSAEATRHARETLELPVREMALEDTVVDAAAQGEQYDAIVAVDILEHLEEPAVALSHLSALLAPGGALLITTPDPSSLAARITGKRWWGYEPAHACLIPRGTLRKLIDAQGLVLAEDCKATQSFSLGYWLRCLSQRGDGMMMRWLAYVAARLPRKVMLTASLGDEMLMLARRPQSDAPARR